MILWKIFKALENSAGIDSDRDFVYNIFKSECRRDFFMDDIAKARFEVCKNHPKQQEIFKLEQLLIKAGYPYFFNFWDDLRPTPFNHDGGNPEMDIDWERYIFFIDVYHRNMNIPSKVRVCLNQEQGNSLLDIVSILDDYYPIPSHEVPEIYSKCRGIPTSGISAEQAMEIIRELL